MANSEKVGVWVIGARGSIGSTVLFSHWWLANQSGHPLGMMTASDAFDDVDFISMEELILGGCDVHSRPLAQTLQRHREEGIIPMSLPEMPGDSIDDLEERIIDVSAATGETAIDVLTRLRKELDSFRKRASVERVIVVNCASTLSLSEEEQRLAVSTCWEDMQDELQRMTSIPWGILHSAAAILEDCPFINFTPNLGSEVPALASLASERGLPHAGKDGKTGETLVKSVLAPMFRGRALRVLAWQGFNILGNSDGASLRDPGAKSIKSASKDQQLRAILPPDPQRHTGVGIEYVPSLGDWKTAWDYIHFEGFLGTRMSMQFVWQGCDTILAAPLVLDLVRLTERAWRHGESGPLDYLCSFFKTPIGCREHDLNRQLARLYRHLNVDGYA